MWLVIGGVMVFVGDLEVFGNSWLRLESFVSIVRH